MLTRGRRAGRHSVTAAKGWTPARCGAKLDRVASADDDSATSLYGEVARGNSTAAERLLQSYLPRLRAFVRARLGPDLRTRESDSDVVQSVCRELLQHKDGFQYRGETEFRGWLFTAAANKVREKFRFHHQARRDSAREQPVESAANALVAGTSASPSYAAIANERMAILEAALDTLGDSDRDVITLARIAGLPMPEVAARMGKSEVAARKQLGRALLRLGQELSKRRSRDSSG